jgi:HEAT repeat protein
MMYRDPRSPITIVITSVLVLSGCTSASEPDPSTLRSAAIEDAPAVVESSATDTDWRTRSARQSEQLRSEQPELVDIIAGLDPRPTRAGFLRFTTPLIHDPAVASLLLARLVEGSDPPEVRAAIVEALPRTGGEYADAVLDLLAEESAPEVRVALVTSLRRAPTSHAVPGLAAALSDDDPAIRALAAETAGLHTDGHALADALQSRLADDDAPTRAAAARALGIFGIADGTEALVELVDDAVPEVRLEALRALTRIDPDTAARLPTLATLQRDADPRIARLARTIRAE